MTRARRCQVEQQQLISVEKALAILSRPTPALVVDHERLRVSGGWARWHCRPLAGFLARLPGVIPGSRGAEPADWSWVLGLH